MGVRMEGHGGGGGRGGGKWGYLKKVHRKYKMNKIT